MGISTGLATGQRLGDYTLERTLGRGGMGVVYAAQDRRLGRRVALKVLSPALGDRQDFRARFLRESRLAASIDHPNVIPVYEAGEADGQLFIGMRLVEGTDLRRRLCLQERLDPARALAIVGQTASALDAAHARGLLHRDVKPANILLASDDAGNDHVYLSDFGLAGPHRSSLGDGSFHGTAQYVAPEQIEGRPEPRSDVYSLACVLFECLTGRPPFTQTRLLATLWSHLNDEPPRPTSVDPELPDAVDSVFAAALAKDPAERPATAGAFVADARAALGVDRAPGSRLRVFAAGAAALGAVLALALVLVFGRDGAEPAASPQGPTVTTLAGSGEPGSAGDGGPARVALLTDPIDVAVDGDGNVYVADWGARRVRRIAADGTITTVAGTGRDGYTGDGGPATEARIGDVDVAIGPDGDLYLLEVARPALRRVDRRGVITTVAGTGEVGVLEDGPRTVSPNLCGQAFGPAFDSRGRIYIACRLAHRVVRVEGDGSLTVVAGSGVAGYSGDGGPATEAALQYPTGIAFDAEDNLYIADVSNNRIRKVDPNGVITTFAGSGTVGLSGDGWRATSVALWQPQAVAVDDAGNVYISENATNRVRKVDRNGIITTLAGTGVPGFAGDGGPAWRARLDSPVGVAVDDAGHVYIADVGNRRVRKVSP